MENVIFRKRRENDLENLSIKYFIDLISRNNSNMNLQLKKAVGKFHDGFHFSAYAINLFSYPF